MQGTMNTNFVKDVSRVLPAGKYYIGDLSYFLNDTIMNIWTTKFKNSDGLYTNDAENGFYVTKPVDGNGIYVGSNKFSYDVDEDNFGIASIALGNIDKYTGCGTFHKFSSPVNIEYNDGVLTFKSNNSEMVIDTNNRVDISSDDEGYDSWS